MASHSSIRPRIISISRRTDIPAYYAEWFMRQVEAGEVVYPNPMSFKPVRLSLRPEHVLFMVFWTRNPHPLEKHLDRLDELFERAYYFHFTINGLPKTLETSNPPLDFSVATFQRFAARYPDRVFWRYDPIVLSDRTPADYHVQKFGELAERLAGATTRCYFSFVNWYQKVQRNFAKTSAQHGILFRDAGLNERLAIVRQLVEMASAHGIQLHSCCQDTLCGVPHVRKAHCVDIETIRALAPERYRKLRRDVSSPIRSTPTREDCGCYESRDIGYYDSCPHGCVYCYANLNRERATSFYAAYLKKKALPSDEATTASHNHFPSLSLLTEQAG